jgi:hypothetical protein
MIDLTNADNSRGHGEAGRLATAQSRVNPPESLQGAEFAEPLTENLSVIRCQDSRNRESTQMQERRTKFTDDEAIDVWLRHFSGQTGDQIAYDYRINAGRVSQVLNQRSHPGSKETALKIWQQCESA